MVLVLITAVEGQYRYMKNTDKERVALLDWDGTLRAGYEITEWCNFLDERGYFEKEVGIRQRTLLSNYLTGKITYSQAVFDVGVNYAEGLSGQKLKDIMILARQFVEKDHAVFKFTSAFFEILHSNKIKLVLISNTPQLLLDKYKKQFKLNEVYGLQTGEKSGTFINEVIINPGLTEAKKKIVAELVNKYYVVLGMGDTHHDVPLLEPAKIRLFMKPHDKPNISIPEGPELKVVDESTVIETVETAVANLSNR
jgi:phosphoserine phosphatase